MSCDNIFLFFKACLTRAGLSNPSLPYITTAYLALNQCMFFGVLLCQIDQILLLEKKTLGYKLESSGAIEYCISSTEINVLGKIGGSS